MLYTNFATAGKTIRSGLGRVACCIGVLPIWIAVPPQFTERQIAILEDQVTRIWQPYGVGVAWSRSDTTPTSPAGALDVVVQGDDGRARRSGDAEPIAWVLFATPTTPTPHVRVSLGAARRLITNIEVAGVMVPDLPGSIGERLVAQTAGRALAHEIGHYLLASHEHSPGGLMRALVTSRLYVDTRLEPFNLNAKQASAIACPAGAGRSAQR